MQKVERIRYLLRDRKLSVIAEATGLTYQSLRNILNGSVRDPKLSTIVKLEEYFNAQG